LLQCTRKSLIEIVFAVAGVAAVGVGVVMNEWAGRPRNASARRGVAGESSLIAAGLHDAVGVHGPRRTAGRGVARRHSCPNPH